MTFNSTLFIEMANALKSTGLQASGYTLISVGGDTYPHQVRNCFAFTECMSCLHTQEFVSVEDKN
jgi:hypothetical protein